MRLVVGLTARADQPIDLFAVLKDNQGRSALNAEPDHGALLLVDVDLSDGELSGVLVGKLGQDRGDHPTGRAPRRPKIDYHRLGGAEHVLVEVGSGDLDRCTYSD